MPFSLTSKLRRHQPRQLFYHFGSRLAVPFPILKTCADTVDKMNRPVNFLGRRRIAKAMLQDSPWRQRMTRASALASFACAELPGAEIVVRDCRAILAARQNEIDELHPRTTFHKLLRNDDLRTYPSLLEFALSAPLVHTIADYLGTVPRLHDIDLWLSPPVNDLRSSHFFHLDKPEVNFVGAFMNVFDVGMDDGPLTVLPADVSESVERQTDYHHRYMLGTDVRIDDEEMSRHIRPEDMISLTGKAGDMSIFDTSRCFHYGSRCRSHSRVMLQFRYAPAHKLRGDEILKSGWMGEGGDPVPRYLLEGYPAAQAAIQPSSSDHV